MEAGTGYYATPANYSGGYPEADTIVLPNNYDPKATATAINEAPPKAHWTGSVGMVIAIIAVILVLVFIFMGLFGNNNCNSGGNAFIWTFNSPGSSASFAATGGFVYLNSNSNSQWTITSPSNNIGQAFIIDNTNVGNSLSVFINNTSSGSSFVIPANTSAQVIWQTTSSVRVYPFA